MAVTRDWIPKQIDKFKVFADNLCERASKNAAKWHLNEGEVAALLALQLIFNGYYKISTVRGTSTSEDTQNTKDARKNYQKTIRKMAMGRMKGNDFMTNIDRRACGLNNHSRGYNLSPVSKTSPIVDYRNKGGLGGNIVCIDPQTLKVCKPKGQDGMKVTFGFYKKGKPIPLEKDCTFTVYLTKCYSKIVFPAAYEGMLFVGYVRYFNTRKIIGLVASKFYGAVD